LLAEGLGTGLLVATVIGSGIHAERLSSDAGLQLLENTAATVAVLVALILALGPVSGAHLNPVVTIADRLLGGVTNREAAAYVLVQIAGACAGAVLANLMFALPAVDLSTNARDGAGVWLGELVASAGLVLVILGVVRSPNRAAVPYAVAAWIGAAYWFTSSTSFANPAVTIGRSLSDTFAGIDPTSVPAFVAAQVVGGLVAVAAALVLFPDLDEVADELVIPHP
jgi:arsenate reductase